MKRELTRIQKIERSLIHTYRKELWAPFLNAITQYDLIQPEDAIAVCISGGKDSMCMAKLFQELQRRSSIPFSLRFIVMDPGYSEAHRRQIDRMPKSLKFRLKCLKQTYSASLKSSRKIPVISVPGCAEGISTIRQSC